METKITNNGGKLKELRFVGDEVIVDTIINDEFHHITNLKFDELDKSFFIENENEIEDLIVNHIKSHFGSYLYLDDCYGDGDIMSFVIRKPYDGIQCNWDYKFTLHLDSKQLQNEQLRELFPSLGKYYEFCPECNTEVLLKDEMVIQECPECHHVVKTKVSDLGEKLKKLTFVGDEVIVDTIMNDEFHHITNLKFDELNKTFSIKNENEIEALVVNHIKSHFGSYLYIDDCYGDGDILSFTMRKPYNDMLCNWDYKFTLHLDSKQLRNDQLRELFPSLGKYYEFCPECNTEVLLKDEMVVQECPECHCMIKPCGLCDECTVCPYDEV